MIANDEKLRLTRDRAVLQRAVEDAGGTVSGTTARCPFHEDNRPSAGLYVSETTGVARFHCHSCDVDLDVFDVTMRSHNCDFVEAVRLLGGTNRSPAHPSRNGNGVSRSASGSKQHKGRIVATYDYTDNQGDLLFQTVRFMPKGFRQRRPNEKGGWVWNLNGVDRVLYRLRSLIDADPDDWVIVVEGEKDADRLVSLGFVATTCPMGAGKWRLADDSVLEGRNVVIVGDADEAGRKHVADVASRLHGRARELRIVDLPGPGKDVSDWCDAGGDAEQLRALVDAALVFKPEPKAKPKPAGPRDKTEFSETDDGNAQRLVAEHGADMRFSVATGYLVWDGVRWRQDDTREVMRRAKATARVMLDDPKVVDKHAERALSRRGLEAMCKLSESEPSVAIRTDRLDTDPMLLNLSNGTIDPRTGKLRQHRRDDLITKLAPVTYDPNVEAPQFMAFLERVIPEPEVRAFVQRAAGYCLTGHTGERVVFILHGTGANGKSVLLDVLRSMLGDYASQTPTATLMTQRSNAIPNDVARLRGARFVTATESNEGEAFNESLIKTMSGGSDTMTARFLHKEFFEFKPEFKLFLATNHKPEIRDTTNSIWDRLRLISFNVVIPEDERDADLPSKLKQESPGILNWALAGCQAWQSDGLATPDSVRAATDEYRRDMDVLGSWIAERCKLADDKTQNATHLYGDYKEWSEKAGHRPLSQTKFGRRLVERPGITKSTSGTVTYRGIRLLLPGEMPE